MKNKIIGVDIGSERIVLSTPTDVLSDELYIPENNRLYNHVYRFINPSVYPPTKSLLTYNMKKDFDGYLINQNNGYCSCKLLFKIFLSNYIKNKNLDCDKLVVTIPSSYHAIHTNELKEIYKESFKRDIVTIPTAEAVTIGDTKAKEKTLYIRLGRYSLDVWVAFRDKQIDIPYYYGTMNIGMDDLFIKFANLLWHTDIKDNKIENNIYNKSIDIAEKLINDIRIEVPSVPNAQKKISWCIRKNLASSFITSDLEAQIKDAMKLIIDSYSFDDSKFDIVFCGIGMLYDYAQSIIRRIKWVHPPSEMRVLHGDCMARGAALYGENPGIIKNFYIRRTYSVGLATNKCEVILKKGDILPNKSVKEYKITGTGSSLMFKLYAGRSTDPQSNVFLKEFVIDSPKGVNPSSKLIIDSNIGIDNCLDIKWKFTNLNFK